MSREGLAAYPSILIPYARRPSGLLVPRRPDDLPERDPLLRTAAASPLFLPDSARPTPQDLLLCAPTPADLDLPTPTLSEAIAPLREIPFEPAMLLTSLVAAELYHHPRDLARQRRLMGSIYPAPLAERVERFLNEDAVHIPFDIRHVLVLQRLLVIHAAPDPDPRRGLSDHEIHRLSGVLVALAGALPTADPPEPADDEDPDWTAWARYFAQTGAWYGDSYVLEAVARTFATFSPIATSDELSDHPARAEVDEQLRAVYGLELAEQLAVGLACAVLSKAVAVDVDTEDRAAPLQPGFLAHGPLGAKEEEVVALISASREELRDALLVAEERPEEVAWDYSVFERFPFLRLPDATLRLHSPRALVAWMTRGMHYRLLDAAGRGLPRAEARKARGRFLTYAGALGESYVRGVVRASLRRAESSGAVRIHGEVEYRVGRERHDGPDFVIDAGPDLVVGEVYSGRMSLSARTNRDPSALDDFVKRATAAKLMELANRVRDILSGQLCFDGLDLGRVRRVYPVLVLAGDPVPQTPLLWGYLRATHPEAFVDDGRVERSIVCDLDDLEPLLALAEEGRHLPELLNRFLRSDHAELPPRNWVAHAHGLERRPAFVADHFRDAMRTARQRLFRAPGDI
jgi:hypothetical protein